MISVVRRGIDIAFLNLGQGVEEIEASRFEVF